MHSFFYVSMVLALVCPLWAASVSDLVGDMDAYQCWRNGKSLMLLDCKSGQSRTVATVSGNVEWAGGPNRDATKIVFWDPGQNVYVVDWDGGNLKRIAGGSHPHFLGNDEVVYLSGGGTYKISIDPSTNEPGDATKLSGTQCEAGITGNGLYLAETYPKSFMIEISSGKKSPHFNGSQNCSGSAHPGDKAQMMFNRDPGHNAMVIGEWDPGSNTTNIIWTYSGGEMFGLWSVNHENFCVMMSHERDPKLVRISDKQSAGISMGGVYCGGPWVGHRVEVPEDDTPPSTPANLSADDAGVSWVELSWDAASDGESDISGYTIYREGEEVGSSETTSYRDEELSEGMTYAYRVSAVNGAGLEGEKSAEISASTEADQTPPSISLVSAVGDATTVSVLFSEPVEQSSAETAGNYTIDNNITVSSASLGDDARTVTLSTSELSRGITYTLTAGNINDRAVTPNVLAQGTQASFELQPYTPGEVAYEYYEGSFSTLPDFETLTPSQEGTVAGFDIEEAAEKGNDYAVRFVGMIEIVEEGEYTFATVSDDGSALHIGETAVVDNDGTHGMEEKSGSITLTSGMHPIIVTYFQGGGGKGLEVKWITPGSGGSAEEIPIDKLYAGSGDVADSRYSAPTGSSAPAPGISVHRSRRRITVAGLDQSGIATVQLVDPSGRILGTAVAEGTTTWIHAPRSVGAGVLLLRVRTGGKEQTVRCMVR